MSGLELTLRREPTERLDCSLLTPANLAGKSSADLARLVLGTSKAPLTLADVFSVSGSAGETLTIVGATPKMDFIAANLADGNMVVEGDVGAFAAAAMRGGRLDIKGSTGPGLASAMKAGIVHVTGSAGDFLGAVRPGAQYGMQGGTVVVDGNVGERTGDRMRRGTIIARGSFGKWAGVRMMGGTLWTLDGFGDEPGLQMRRGTLIAPRVTRLLTTFGDGGTHDLVILRIISRDLKQRLGPLAPPALPPKVRKLSGDNAVFGKGELLLTA